MKVEMSDKLLAEGIGCAIFKLMESEDLSLEDLKEISSESMQQGFSNVIDKLFKEKSPPFWFEEVCAEAVRHAERFNTLWFIDDRNEFRNTLDKLENRIKELEEKIGK